MRKIAFYFSLMVIFLIPWENAITVGNLGTLTKVVGGAAALVWLLSILIVGRIRKPILFHVLMIFFVLWNIASSFWSLGLDITIMRIQTYIQLAILAWILWDLYRTPQALTAALQAYILGAYVTIASTISNFLAGKQISATEPGRFAGAGLNAVDLALVLSLGLPIAWHLATSKGPDAHERFFRIINLAYIPLGLLAIILTGSRVALFTCVPAFIYIFATSIRLKLHLRIVIFISLMAGIFYLQSFVPQATIDRLATTRESILSLDLGGRGRLWEESYEIFLNHPFVGVGSGALNTPSLLGSVAHNTFLSILTELGLVGFFTFIFLLGIIFYRALNQPNGLTSLWITVLAIWVVGVFTLTWEYFKPTWLIFSLIVISAYSFKGQENTSRDLNVITQRSDTYLRELEKS